ncbi:uncharacterized protein LOC130449834 [Diorhabda sublineata]|uniref:uncharacterized protein LOC130449834 n=1 Tax=Diorhabda sublineata TaxID=1163346 RepID=UPI0024E0BF2A|nr:uncharacterized protein LOC130449834 [Diorhabda sublineata]
MSQRFIYPSLMDIGATASNIKSDIERQNSSSVDEERKGCDNVGLEVYNEFVGVANRELVNLENAAVNIDNSNDVIIGPVTQFNVNGNVTIYQGNDGQPIEIKDGSEIPNSSCEDQSPRPQKEEQDGSFSTKRKFPLKYYLGTILFLFVISGITAILVFQLRKNTQEEPNEWSITDSISLGDHRLISKKDWGGRPARKTTPMPTPVNLVIIKHTASTVCDNYEACVKKLVTIQTDDMSNRNYSDIYFNFAVGGDGNVYVGRGWNAKPASGYNNIDLVIIGNFGLDPFTPLMISATKALLVYGLEKNMLTENYRLINHNQTTPTLSPGVNVIVEVRKWPHYDGRNYIGQPLPYVESSVFVFSDNNFGFNYTYDVEYSNYVKEKMLEFKLNLKKYGISWISCVLVTVFLIMTVLQQVNTESDQNNSYPNNNESFCDCPVEVFSRSDWGGVNPTATKSRQKPIQYVIIKHTELYFCENVSKCKYMTKNIQKRDMAKNFSDISYNFLVGGDGNVYVGRGFSKLGENLSLSIDIALHGNFFFDQYYECMIAATKLIIDYGLATNQISKNYSLLSHNQTLKGTDSPGRNVFKEIATWQDYHYDRNTANLFRGCILKLYKVYIKFYPDVKKILSRLLMSTILTSCALCLYLGVVSVNKIQRKLPYDTSIYKKLGNYSIYYIDQWGEENGIEFDVNPLPVGLVIIGDTKTKTCDNFDDCSKILKSYQQYEIISLGYKNICENFLISTDGTIYVGRGWDVRNCYDRLSIEISFIGNFNKHKMSKDMITSLLLLLNHGQKLYKLPNDYIIIALNQTIDTLSPGEYVYEVIKNMCHFSNINLKSRFSYYFFSFIYDVTKFFNNIFSTTICLQTFSL